MPWTTFRLTVTTPLFTHEDRTTGLRLASIRGAMRYWFRALAGTRIGNDVHALAREEQRIFGSTDRACPVRMRLANQPADSFMRKALDDSIVGKEAQGVAYLLGQGLAKYDSTEKTCTFTRRHTRPGGGLILKIRFSEEPDIDAPTMASLWLACTYGGFGARTRKGFGGARLTHLEGYLPDIWKGCADTPGPEHYRDLDHLPVTGPLADCADLLRVPEPVGAGGEPETPLYPTLGPGATTAALSAFTGRDWRELAAEAGERYRRFRAPCPHGSDDPGYDPPIKTAEYGNVVHGNEDRFPLGALGLPVNFKKIAGVNAYKDKEPLRRASPLWFRFIEDPDEREWRLFSFAFHSVFLPPQENLKTRLIGGRGPRDLRVDETDVRDRTREWLKSLSS
ncbi:type III-B CRISPR module RAMP protein Cmr1 [Nocardiopsis potens]|uniref:type III-B CRISPR module RAMP protein Cmr1 n=1 Tax=Nocardiopsis potens TaxID=1246458 RepID=UPI00034A2CCA|nr:type III-B CRISPR module RAMP protein Cmr1 [Nocardiopsis potens]